ncbi:MAG: hypothetical protein U0166_04215 [Acidobacteriota bacterium]
MVTSTEVADAQRVVELHELVGDAGQGAVAERRHVAAPTPDERREEPEGEPSESAVLADVDDFLRAPMRTGFVRKMFHARSAAVATIPASHAARRAEPRQTRMAAAIPVTAAAQSPASRGRSKRGSL